MSQTLRKQLALLIILLLSTQLFAQSNKTFEKVLYNHFTKTQKSYYPDEMTDKAYQSIIDANEVFTEELVYYLKTQPETIKDNFNSFVKKGFTVTTSKDGNFRIYSWSINLGGKENFYYNIFQYMFKNKHGIWADKENDYEGDYIIDVFEAKLNGKQYYFPYTQSASGHVVENAIYNFSVSENRISNEDKIFKVGKDPESSISIGFDFFSVLDHEERPVRLIKFNAETKTFTFPVIDPQTMKVSLTETEQIKFSGNYFE